MRDLLGNVNNYDLVNYLVGDLSGYAFVHMIQFDAGATHGDSGGPLLDKDGTVIGIIDSLEPEAEFIHFATPIIVLKTVMPNLITNGVYKHPWIGIEGINAENGGCKIVQTDPKSPLSNINGMSGRTNSLVHIKASRHSFFNSFPHTVYSIQFDSNFNSFFQSLIPINRCSDLLDAIENHQYSIGGTTGQTISLYLDPPNMASTTEPVLITAGERWL